MSRRSDTVPLVQPPPDEASANSVESVLLDVTNARPDQPIIVDFDETLFFRNSTQAYLGSIYPRSLGAAFLIAIKVIKPWRFFPSPYRENKISRDWFLVVTATILFPWTLLVWQKRAKKLAERYCNRPLAQAIDANAQAPFIIATLGFDWVVQPLIRHLPMTSVKSGRAQVIACRFWQGALDRAAGKLDMVRKALGKAAVSRSVVVTDSDTDQPLLDVVEKPCLLVWTEAKFVPAMSDLYIPLFYSEKIKNPGKAHFVKRVLLEHWMFGVIAWSLMSVHPWLNGISLLFLTLSYWCVYEIGYQENDNVGEKYERQPTLSTAYRQQKYGVSLSTPWPWLYGFAFGLLGCALFALSQSSLPLASSVPQLYAGIYPWAPTPLMMTTLVGCALWVAYLLVIRSCFWLYNQLNEATRIWVYPLLQAQRMFGFGVLASTSTVGALLLASSVISRWIQYCVYRCGGDRTLFPVNISCFLLFSLLFASLALNTNTPRDLLTGQVIVAFLYVALRAFRKIRHLKSRVGFLKR